MERLRAALFEPTDRYDVAPGSWRGLLAGLFQAGLHLIGFATLFVLAIALDVIDPNGAAGATAVFWVMVLVGVVTGAGIVWLARDDRVDRFWRTVAGRLVTVLALYAAFWGLLAAVGLDAVFAGLAFVVARVGAHVWRVRQARA